MRSGAPRPVGFSGSLGSVSQTLSTWPRRCAGVLAAPITDVRDNAPFGVLCEVRIPVAGLREHRDRIVAVTSSWELRHADDAPRLVTAYIDG